MYLARFGYLDPAVQNPSSAALVSGETVKRAIVDFQAFAGLNQTGKQKIYCFLPYTVLLMGDTNGRMRHSTGYKSDWQHRIFQCRGSERVSRK